MSKKREKILTDGWGEILIYQLTDYIPYQIERLNKGILGKKSFDGGDLRNAFHMKKYESSLEYGVIHYNNWLDPLVCKVPKNKITIWQSHGIHIGLGLRNSMRAVEKPYMRLIALPMHIFYFIFLLYKVRKFDLYVTSIPSALPYAKRLSKKAVWLPNAVDVDFFNDSQEPITLDKNKINIFLPSAIRILKNQEKAWEIIDLIYEKYKNIGVYIIDHPLSNEELVRPYLDKFSSYITVLPLIEREKISTYYKAPWDLVLGNMCQYPTNAMLNMIELEAMVCKAPIVAMDVFEIIKIPYNEINEFAIKVLEDTKFRKEYIEKNFQYVLDVHSRKKVAELYFSLISGIKK